MLAGGEFFDDDRWITSSPTLMLEGLLFLNGGRACLDVICKWLCANKIHRILLPSYLCPSILDVLDSQGMNYDFYRIKEDFSIDLDDLRSKAKEYKTIYLINYFGFQHSEATKTVLKHLQQNGVLLIEDNAQAGFPSHSIGDFVFNSMRKFTACDGGYLKTPFDMSNIIEKYSGRENHRLPLIREYRSRLPAYLFAGQGDWSDLESLFEQAEVFYETDGVVLGDPEEKVKIERQDWQAIKARRRRNYEALLQRIYQISGITPLFSCLQEDNMPLGLPVYVAGGHRDEVIEALSDANINLAIHWEALMSDRRTLNNPLVVKMASNILTLAIDQNMTIDQIDYEANVLREILKRLSKKCMEN